jgi:hypothetical protein
LAHLQSATDNRSAAYDNYNRVYTTLKDKNPSDADAEFERLFKEHDCYRNAHCEQRNMMDMTFEAVILNNSES